jgi:hypothetical protein
MRTVLQGRPESAGPVIRKLGAVGRSYPAAVRQLNGTMAHDRFPATVVKISIHMILKVI